MRNLRKQLYINALIGLLFGCIFPACAADRDNAPGQRQTLMHDGVERSYVIRVPQAVAQQPNRRVALVLVLHGGGGNAANAEATTGFTEKAEREGFIVVYPEGSSRFMGKLLTWNAGHCCGYAMNNRVDDVGFISALIDTLIANYPIDPKRIYATGISNGAMMSHRLGIELSNKIAAIAPVVGALFGDERKPPYPVAALIFNGMLDEHIPQQGGPPGGRFAGAWDGMSVKPAREQGTFWASANGCTSTPDTQDRGAFIFSQYHCPTGRGVEFYLIKDNGHAWPGGQAGSRMGDKPSTSLNATDIIWAFFNAHPK
jgi:polyhydroxybutyrate depolymerase